MSNPLTISLVPGYVMTPGEKLTVAILNAIANPNINLSGSLTAALLGDGSVDVNKLAVNALAATTLGLSRMQDGYFTSGANHAAALAKMDDAFLSAAKLDNAARGSVHQFAAGVLGGTTYAVTLSPVPTLATGMVVRFKPDTNCPAGGCSLNLNGLGAIAIKREVSRNPNLGDITVNQVCEVIYDGTVWQLFSPRTSWFASAQQTIPGAGLDGTVLAATAHGLGAAPIEVRGVIVCTDAGGDGGYAQNDELDARSVANGAIFAWWSSSSQVGASKLHTNGLGAGGASQVINKGGTLQDINLAAKWAFKLYARGYS